MSTTVREIITEAASRSNVCPRKRVLPDDLFVSGLNLLDGVMQEFSSKDYITAYQNEVNFNPTAETIKIGEAEDADVVANGLQLPKRVLYKYNGAVDWTPMEFIAYENFYSGAYSDFVVSWQPIGNNLYKLFFKPRFIANGPVCKLIYNVEMKYKDGDTINLPTPYIELITRDLAYKFAVKFPRAGQEKQLSLKNEFDDLEKSLKSTNASLKIITRGGTPASGPYRGMLREGSFISNQW